MGASQRVKGHRYERKVASWYRKWGYNARRGSQSDDGAREGDVVLDDCDWWLECKHHKTCGFVHRAYAKAKKDAGPGRYVILHTHEDGGEHLVTMSVSHWADVTGINPVVI